MDFRWPKTSMFVFFSNQQVLQIKQENTFFVVALQYDVLYVNDFWSFNIWLMFGYIRHKHYMVKIQERPRTHLKVTSFDC